MLYQGKTGLGRVHYVEEQQRVGDITGPQEGADATTASHVLCNTALYDESTVLEHLEDFFPKLWFTK